MVFPFTSAATLYAAQMTVRRSLQFFRAFHRVDVADRIGTARRAGGVPKLGTATSVLFGIAVQCCEVPALLADACDAAVSY
jgi:hypothetical protein